MKTAAAFLSSLLAVCSLSTAEPDFYPCQLPDMIMLDPEPFPDIEKLGTESYEMTVEFTIPGMNQTDYYVEYYDSLNRMGRVEAHQENELLTHIYRTDTWEAWSLRGRTCELSNVTERPDLLRDFQTDWIYEVEGDPSRRTVGPSAMFKTAYDRWNHKELKRSMAFLGEMPHMRIRGHKARVWRWCQAENVSVDYYFTTEDKDSANAFKVKTLPLRVTFLGARKEELQILTDQYYDIVNFEPYISFGLHPFQLPKGLGCGRGTNIEAPSLPKLEEGSAVLFYAEVIYRRVIAKTQEDISSYYSNIMFAADPLYNSIAYLYSPWNETKVKGEDGEKDRMKVFSESPQYIIFDAGLDYSYMLDYENDKCDIKRGKEFVPLYRLPEGGGDLDLRNPYVFFPNKDFKYLTKGYDRGLEVEIFESVKEGYLMTLFEEANKVIASHSFLVGDERMNNVVTTKNTPMQTEMHIFRGDNSVEEILTFNFFGYTTKFTSYRQKLFDLSSCFKNDDAYSWVTIVFSIPADVVDNFDVDATAATARLLKELYGSDGEWFEDTNAVSPSRVPTVTVDLQEDLSFTFLLLEKPPLQMDFPDMEEGKKVDVEQIGELMTFDTCATACLEAGSCWGFSLCGGLCSMGDGAKVDKVLDDKDCKLYRRYINDTYMKPKSAIINSLKRKVTEGMLKLTVVNKLTNAEVITTAIYIKEKDPSENDETFEKMGHILSERMRVLKVGKKLKQGKSLGKLRFDECQRLCLNYPDCETISICLFNSECTISPKYGDELGDTEIVEDKLCQLVTRTYADHFDVTPGYFVQADAKKSLKVKDAEACARACLKESGFECRSVDMCSEDPSGNNCFLHATHFLKKDTRKDELGTKASCSHHSRKYSVEFKKHIQTRVKGTKVVPITHLDLEECAKRCVDFNRGGCYGFDFCQGKTPKEPGSCILIDSDPSRLDNAYSSVCTQYLRDDPEYAPRPYSNSYAGGIGFLCFLVGGLIGAAIVFGIAYIRVNRG